MKLDPRRTEPYLRDPGPSRAALLYGDDLGLIRERAQALVRVVAGSLDDPFRVVEVERSGFGSIGAEFASLSLTGGRRVVRVREATDAATAAVKEALGRSGSGFIVLEGGALPARSTLRALIDRSDEAVSIGCYPQEGRSLLPVIRDTLGEAGVSADDEALEWLTGQLGVDRGVTRQEIEKLALYAGAGGRVDLSTARLSVGDLAGLSTDDALFAAMIGDVGATDRALELALAEGGTPVGILRQALGHIQRLAKAREAVGNGTSPTEAAREVRPPLYFRRQASFIQALSLWTDKALSWAAGRLWEAERACKTTGMPADTLCRNALIGVAQRAASTRRR